VNSGGGAYGLPALHRGALRVPLSRQVALRVVLLLSDAAAIGKNHLERENPAKLRRTESQWFQRNACHCPDHQAGNRPGPSLPNDKSATEELSAKLLQMNNRPQRQSVVQWQILRQQP
jgi:hypothetical protein